VGVDSYIIRIKWGSEAEMTQRLREKLKNPAHQPISLSADPDRDEIVVLVQA